MKLLGDPGYVLLNIALTIGAVCLAIPIAMVAGAFAVDDFLFGHSAEYRQTHTH